MLYDYCHVSFTISYALVIKDLTSNFPGEINLPFYVMIFGEGQQPALCSPLHNNVRTPKYS